MMHKMYTCVMYSSNAESEILLKHSGASEVFDILVLYKSDYYYYYYYYYYNLMIFQEHTHT